MKKHRKVLLVLLALVLITGVGAKMYSDVTMGDDEWIGLGATAGRIVFDDQSPDEVTVMNARFGIGLDDPAAFLHTKSSLAVIFNRENAGTNDVAPVLTLKRTSTGTVADGYGSGLRYVLETGSDTMRQAGNVSVAWSDVSEEESYMSFELRDGSVAERMRLTHDGKLGIGTSTPNQELDVAGDIDATGEIHSDLQVSSSGHVFASGDVFAIGDVTAHNNLVTSNDVLANYGTMYGEYVYATTAVSSSGFVYAYTSVIANGNVYAGGDIFTFGDVDADGDVTAGGNVTTTGDVTAGGSVFIGSDEDGNEDGDHMLIRADTADGGCVTWAESDFTGGAGIFTGSVGPETVLHVRWLTHSDTTEAYTSGETYLVDDSDVTIASDGDKEDLVLVFDDDDLTLWTVGSVGHYYDVVLQIMWVED